MKTGLILAGWSRSDKAPIAMRFRVPTGRARWFDVLRGIAAVHGGSRLYVAIREPYERDFRCLVLAADRRGRVRETRGWRVKRTLSLMATGRAFGREAVAR